jgi:predicted SnoaL-like aldol condensation-catalyzing enzyme
VALLKAIETGASEPIGYVNAANYKQHNLSVEDGLDGFVRAFEDGDFVVCHTDYNFFGPKAGFDLFRIENGKIAEHWDVMETIAPESEWKHQNGKFGGLK